jgi:hypothetical protein
MTKYKIHRRKMKKILSIITATAASLILFTNGAQAATYYISGSDGVDVSYPNCSVKIPSVNFGVVGVNNGLVYGHNSCLGAEAKNFTDLSLYLNTGLNTAQSSPYYVQAQAGCNGDVNCAAYNYGYNAAVDAVNYAKSQGVSNKWWLDVETMNTWNSDVLQNQKSLQGQYDALIANGASLSGVYSTTAQWQSITGGWQNNWPSWGATTWTTAKQAQSYCTGHQFTGGLSLLMQYKSKQSKVDQDVAC